MNHKPLNLPEEFVQNMLDIYGDEGQTWLDEFPQALQDLGNLWQLKLIAAMPNLTYSYVAVVETKGKRAVLKLAPKSDRLKREVSWYQWQKTPVLSFLIAIYRVVLCF